MESYLRARIISSSPELRSLEAQIRACALKKANIAAISEKEANCKLKQSIDRDYASILNEISDEEQKKVAFKKAAKHAKTVKTNRELLDQIAEKKSRNAEACAENAIKSLSEVDEVQMKINEREESLKKKILNQESTRHYLSTQTKMKLLQDQEETLKERANLCDIKEYQMKKNIEEELYQQQQQFHQLRKNLREYSLLSQLEKHHRQEQQIQELRTEMDVLLYDQRKNKEERDKEFQRQTARGDTSLGYLQQMREKQEKLIQEKNNEERYREILLAVQAEEAHLDDLVMEAKKRRQRNHQDLADQVLEERRLLRATLRCRQTEELDALAHYEQLRQKVIEEEEKQILLRHAPHLSQYFTPTLLRKMNELK